MFEKIRLNPICKEQHKMGEEENLSAEQWRERYKLLESKMSNFHNQAMIIKTKFAKKIEALSEDCKIANERAANAEKELSKLQSELLSNLDSENNKDTEIMNLEMQLEEKNEIIKDLTRQLEQEKQHRKLDKETLNNKAAEIKNWVEFKLSEAEDQKRVLIGANKRASDALLEWQTKVQEQSIEIGRLRTQLREKSLERKTLKPIQTNGSMSYDGTIASKSSGIDSDDCATLTSVIQEVNRPQRPRGKKSNIEHSHSFSHTEKLSVAARNIDINRSKSLDKQSKPARWNKHKKQSTTVENIGKNYYDKDDSSSGTEGSYSTGKKDKKKSSPDKKDVSGHHNSFIGTFTRKFRGLTDSHYHNASQTTRQVQRSHSAGKRDDKKSKSPIGKQTVTNKHASSPPIVTKDSIKVHKNSAKLGLCTSGHHSETSLLSKTLNEEDEYMTTHEENMDTSNGTPPAHMTYNSFSLPTRFTAKQHSSTYNDTPTAKLTHPPTPPMHKTPLWETRISNQLKDAFVISGGGTSKPFYSKHYPLTCHHFSNEQTADMYKKEQLNIPVYSKIKGRLACLQNVPFSDASDSSEDEFVPLAPSMLQKPPMRNRSHSTDFTMLHWRNGSPGLSRSLKRANSMQSVTSSEGDYAIPPDAQSNCSDDEPEHKLFKTNLSSASNPSRRSRHSISNSCSNSNEDMAPAVQQDKGGYLNKLGGRTKTWRRRWFVIKDGKLLYYKSNDMTRKMMGSVDLTDDCYIVNNPVKDVALYFQLHTRKRTIHLAADSLHSAEEWMKALQSAIGRPLNQLNFRKLSVTETERISLQEWVSRGYENGRNKAMWTCLGTNSIYFYKDANKSTLINQVSLVNSHIHPGSDYDAANTTEHSVWVKFPEHDNQQRSDIILNFNTKEEKAAWMHRLTLASGSLTLPSTMDTCDFIVGTPFERLIGRLMYAALCDTDNGEDSTAVAAGNPLWRNPVLSYSADGLTQPLTSLSSVTLQNQAIQLSKICEVFVNTPLKASDLQVHITLVQQIAVLCVQYTQLQGEIVAQLIKLTNRKKVRKNDQTGVYDIDEDAKLQCWKLLAILLPLFIVHERLSWFLKAHLYRHGDPSSPIGQYVAYCRHALDRANKTTPRLCPPSTMEITSILTQNPNQHSLPFSSPTHMQDNEYYVCSYDGSSTVDEFQRRICVAVGVADPHSSGFALYSDDPSHLADVQHLLPTNAKICDVLFEWEQCYKTNCAMKPTSDPMRTIKLSLRKRLFTNNSINTETEKEKLLIVHQLSTDISSDIVPLSKEISNELAALFAQITSGDTPSIASTFPDIVISQCFPKRYYNNLSKNQQKLLRDKLYEKWASLRGASQANCVRLFLNTLREWPLYGAKLFKAKTSRHKTSVWLALCSNFIAELYYKSMEVRCMYMYSDVTTFGGCAESLLIALEISGASAKIVYHMNNVDILEAISLMSDYMELDVCSKQSRFNGK